MNILHITDFHFKNFDRFKNKSILILDKLISSIIDTIKNESIDFMFFTGDLVFSGVENIDFDIAKGILLTRLQSELSVNPANVFICPGNHDIDRSKISFAVLDKIDKFTTNDAIDEFIQKRDQDYYSSNLPLQNYIKFRNEFYKDNLKDTLDDNFSIHTRVFKDKQISFVTLHSSWVSRDDTDKGKLLVPLSIVEKILNEIKHSDYKFLLIHHPLENLKEFNYSKIEDEIYSNFDFIFSGDVHKKKNSLRFSNDKAAIEILTPATITSDDSGYIGYSIVKFDEEIDQANLIVMQYEPIRKTFIELSTNKINLPREQEKQFLHKIRRSIRNIYEREIENSTKMFVKNYTNEISNQSFHDLFNPPNLKNKGDIENLIENKSNNFDYQDLLNGENYIIFGSSKSGKTSLLKYIQLHLLKEYYTNKIIPIYLDVSKQELTKELVSNQIHKEFNTFKRADVDKIIDNYKIKILLDNCTQTPDNIMKFLSESDFSSNFTFILTMNKVSNDSFYEYANKINLNKKVKYVYINELTRKQIKSYSKKIIHDIPDQDLDVLTNNLVNSFSQFGISMNYWTVAIFIYIYKQTRDFTYKNNTELIENYIEKLLDKDALSHSNSRKVTYDILLNYLGELSYHLYMFFENDDYAISETDLFKFTTDFKGQNKRNVFTERLIIDYLFDKDILVYKDEGNSKISFRLNGEFEYFLAYYLSRDEEKNKSFRNSILNDDKKYLSFINEFELYSGFKKKDKEFLKLIYDKVKLALQKMNSNFSTNNMTHDSNLLLHIPDSKQIIDKMKNNLLQLGNVKAGDAVKIDGEFDNNEFGQISDVKKKRKFTSYEDYNYYERNLFLLGRIYRNMYEIDDELTDEVIDFIFNSNCNVSNTLFDELKNINNPFLLQYLKDNEYTKIQNFLNFNILLIPLIVQTNLYHYIGHENLENVIEENLAKLLKDPSNNQYQLFILVLLKTDIDLYSNMKSLEILKDNININALLNCLLIKIKFYLLFKTYGKSDLQDYLNKLYTEIALKVNPTSDRKKKAKEVSKELQHIEKQKVLLNKKEN